LPREQELYAIELVSGVISLDAPDFLVEKTALT
jgi:hypothetical protein